MANPVTQGELAKALDALILQEQKNDLQPDEITVTQLVKQSGWEEKRARRTLRRWVEEGIMEYVGRRRDQSANGQMVEAWKLVEK